MNYIESFKDIRRSRVRLFTPRQAMLNECTCDILHRREDQCHKGKVLVFGHIFCNIVGEQNERFQLHGLLCIATIKIISAKQTNYSRGIFNMASTSLNKSSFRWPSRMCTTTPLSVCLFVSLVSTVGRGRDLIDEDDTRPFKAAGALAMHFWRF